MGGDGGPNDDAPARAYAPPEPLTYGGQSFPGLTHQDIHSMMYRPVSVSGNAETAANTPSALEQQIRQQWGGYGNWDVKGVNRARELADLLALHGVTSLGDITPVVTETPWSDPGGWRIYGQGDSESTYWADPTSGVDRRTQLKIGDKTLGFLGDYNLDNTYGSKAGEYLQDNNRVGWSARGDGNVSYFLRQDPRTGKYFIAPEWGSSSDKADILQVAQLGLMFVPGVGQALGTALGATGLAASALGNALISGTMAELGGGDFLKGAAAGGLGALGGQLITPIAGDIGSTVGSSIGSEAVGDAVTKALTNAATSGIRAITSGKDVSDALLSGAVSGGVSSGIGDLVGEYAGSLPDPIENFISKTISDKLTSEILGTQTPSTTQNLTDAVTTGGGSSGGASSLPAGGLGGSGLESLMLLPLLAQGEEQQYEPPNYARTLRSPFGSILG